MMNRTTRVRLAAAGLLAAIFASGVAVGFALDRGVAQASPEERTERSAREEAPSPRNGWIIDHMDLTEDQRTRIDSVISHYGGHMTDLQREYRPRFRAVVDSTGRAIREILTEEQLERYQALEAEIERHRRSGGDQERGR